MKLSILDQSPVISGLGARRAIEETLALARRADELGYHRYWLAEHHAIAALADPCPEILLARLGAETRRMRVGTGGVLLPYYSAFRTAETFRMLEALYPGRIDLGVGRAPGGDARTAQAVGGGALSRRRALPRSRCGSWPALLEGKPTIRSRVRLQPEVDTVPEVWLLGSSDYSGALAASSACAFAFAHFINPRGGDEVARVYREMFKATETRPKPKSSSAPSPSAARPTRTPSASPRRSTCAGCTWRSTSTRRCRPPRKPRAIATATRSAATSWGSAPAR